MANELKLKRRLSGNAGAPAALKTAEPAMNFIDDTLYIGKGDDGSGNATSVLALAGPGAFLDRSSAQSVAGKKTFSTVPAATQDGSANNDLLRKSQIEGLLSGKVAASHTHAQSAITDLVSDLAAKAPLASPALTGTPTAPTPAGSDSSTKIATTAYVQGELGNFGAGDMARSVYDTDANGKVDAAEVADAAPWTGITGKPSTFAPAAHTHAQSEVTGLVSGLAAKAPLASPALTGNPTAPTQAAGNSTTRLATTAFVSNAVSALVDGAPGAIDTLNELAAALGDDPNFASTMTSALAGKLASASNLSDVADAATARSNLGLDSMATQAANAVAITGGTVDGIALDCGTF